MKLGRIRSASITAALLSLGAVGCDTPAAATVPAPPASQYIVGIDLSASRSATALRESRALVDTIIDAKLRNGDKVVLLEMYGDSDAASHQYTEEVPKLHKVGAVSPGDKQRLDDAKASIHAVLGAMFDSSRARKIQSTDIFGTLARTADYAHGSNGRQTTLILLTDMENSTPQVRMENDAGIPSVRWIATRKAAHQLPEMPGICVVVAGAASSSSHEAHIRDFWFEYLKAVGATLPPGNYRQFIASPSEVRC